MPGLLGLSGSETCILWRRVSLASAFKEYLLFYHDTMQTITEVMWGWFFCFLFAIFHYNCETSKKFQRALLRPQKTLQAPCNSRGWFPLRIKQRLRWFCKSKITTARTIFIFHLKTCWCSNCVIVSIIVTQNLLHRNQDRRRRVWHDVIFVLKTSEKSSQNGKKERRF